MARTVWDSNFADPGEHLEEWRLAQSSHRSITRCDSGLIENRTGNSLWSSDLERSRGRGWLSGTEFATGWSRRLRLLRRKVTSISTLSSARNTGLSKVCRQASDGRSVVYQTRPGRPLMVSGSGRRCRISFYLPRSPLGSDSVALSP